MIPSVSILLPNLNNRPFLEERLQSILRQNLDDWELVIVDNESDDGAWEYFREWAAKDPRIRISQAPRRGMYDNWNNCIRLARGRYVYIATSDDTMSQRFLEVMVQALEQYGQCDLAHCKLAIIDDQGAPYQALQWDRFYSSVYFGDLINRRHIRLAPHDGLLHCGVRTVYTSITQLLIRRTLFERIGLFRTDCGSIADFEWEMRASLVAHTVHIPEYLAAWRVHPSQGTDLEFLDSSKCLRRLAKLTAHAFRRARNIDPFSLAGIKIKDLKRLYLRQSLKAEIVGQQQKRGSWSRWDQIGLGLKWMLTSPGTLWDLWRSSRRRSSSPEKKEAILDPLRFSKELLDRYGFSDHLKILD
jgi:glycosyltransferase involved in cell wall biosynthesis